MFGSSELQKAFRAAPWTSQQEIEAYVVQAGAVPPSDLAKLLPLLSERSLVADVRGHKARCLTFSKLVEAQPNQELFVPLIKAVPTSDPLLRQVLVNAIPRVNNVAKHVELCRLLELPDPDVRKVGVVLLRALGGPSAFDVLKELASTREFLGRIEAMDAIVAKAGQHSIPLLSAVLTSGTQPERLTALKYLGDERVMGKAPGAAIAVSKTALDDNDPRVAQAAAGAVASLATEEVFFAAIADLIDGANLTRTKTLLEGIKRYNSPRVLDFYTRKFRQGPMAIRLAVLEAIAASGGETALPLLVEALSHRRMEVRTRAGDVLSELATSGRADVARTILWLLRSRDPTVRRIAVDIAKRVGDQAAVELAPKLLGFLKDEDWWVRERVMDALATMAGTELTRHLVEYLTDPSDVVRRFAIGGLVRLKDLRAVGALVRCALGDTDWWVREQAVEALAGLHDARVLPYLVQVMQQHPTERLACIRAITSVGPQGLSGTLVTYLGDEDPDVRLAALEALSAADDRAFASAIKLCSEDSVFRVRIAAQELLVRWAFMSSITEGMTNEAKNVLDRILVAMAQANADDLIVGAGRPPYVKKHGKMTQFSQTVFDDAMVRAILLPHLSAVQITEIEACRDVDLSYEVKTHKLRFRGHIFHQMTGLAAVFRIVKSTLPSITELGLPPVVQTFGDFKNGLVLVGGPTGSGKSTTLAALIDAINAREALHILTIEDPIEVVHAPKKSLINQREVGSHTVSFASALRATLRQDPDVILVGELRDLQTIAFAVSAAETGHLVFGTVHTVSADTSIDRLINTFPPMQQPQVRTMLADTLRAVCCQHLVRKSDGSGRALAVEVMLNNEATSNLIRKGRTFQIPSVIATSRDVGMQTMDSELIRLTKAGVIAEAEGYAKAIDKKAYEAAIGMTREAPTGMNPRPSLSGAGPTRSNA